jgi:hypothetical protein
VPRAAVRRVARAGRVFLAVAAERRRQRERRREDDRAHADPEGTDAAAGARAVLERALRDAQAIDLREQHARLEANYQWKYALTLEPEAEEEKRIREKLEKGLIEEPSTRAALDNGQVTPPSRKTE